MKHLTLNQILQIHAYQIERFGGEAGLRSLELLDSAVAQPRATFGGQPLYPTLADQAAALAFSLVRNHPFVDGNKRTGHAALTMHLRRNGHTIKAHWEEQAVIFERLAAGDLNREGLVAWVRARISRK